MGAWGRGTFENDDAANWLHELGGSGIEAVSSALNTVAKLPGDAYLEAPEASQAVAAAEVVAAARDGDVSRLPEVAQLALQKHRQSIINASLVGLAFRAMTRVLTQSELKELWEEGKDGVIWIEEMNGLLMRLK